MRKCWWRGVPAHGRGLSCGKTSSEVTNDAVAVWAAVGWNRKNMTIKKDLVLRNFFFKIVSLFPVHVKLKDAFTEKWFLNCTLSPLLPPLISSATTKALKVIFVQTLKAGTILILFVAKNSRAIKFCRVNLISFVTKTTLLLVDNCPTRKSMLVLIGSLIWLSAEPR